jgi:probable HAF family extracellular repeat protein
MPRTAPSYTFTTINAPGVVPEDVVPDAINDRGEVVGTYDDSGGTEHGFLYDNGAFTTLDVPGAVSRYGIGVAAINDRGEVVGSYFTSSGEHGFIYDDGTYTTLNAPGAPGDVFTFAEAINDRGEVAGGYLIDLEQGGSFIYENGALTTLNLNIPGHPTSTSFNGINDSGEVVGNAQYIHIGPPQGFLYDNGTITMLDPPGATSSFAAAINDRGEVVGTYDDSSGDHGFIYDNGTFTTLDAPYDPVQINDRGEVAGNYFDSSDTEHGFVYDDGTYTTLNVPGATSTSVSAINDRGEVTGFYVDSSGTHGFVATPHGGEAAFATFGELLAHAHHDGVNDLLPRIPGNRGGSPHSANGAGMIDQTPDARFASFGGVASDDIAAQAWLHGNGTSPGTG